MGGRAVAGLAGPEPAFAVSRPEPPVRSPGSRCPSPYSTTLRGLGVGTQGSRVRTRHWATLEGTVSFVGLRGTGAELQMRVGNDDIRVGVFEGGDSLPKLCLRTRVKVSGIYEEVVNEDGSTLQA